MSIVSTLVAPRHADDVVNVLCEAFHDYPVMQFILAGDEGSYDVRLERLIGFFTRARLLRDEPVLGIFDPEQDPTRLMAAALVSYPGRRESPPELAILREDLWGELGGEARARYESFGAACQPFPILGSPLHLNMLGVRRAARGRGLGGRILAHVHEMSRNDPESPGVTLTTEDPDNVPLYQHVGYRLLGRAQVAPGLHSWCFYRPDDA